jgi:2-polyprenyl-3-methyl-5-hydroxy-6-metoxy-1,4-benzoquinol methylase
MNDITQENIRYYDQLYKSKAWFVWWLHSYLSYDQQSKRRPNMQIINDILKNSRSQCLKIMDYGCGWGTLLLHIKSNRIGLYCYDISENAIQGIQALMKKLGRNVYRVEYDKNGDLLPDKMDLIICSHVIEHVKDDRSLMHTLVRALKPNGYLLINAPINERNYDPKHAHVYSPADLRRMMVDEGLEICREKQAGKLDGLIDNTSKSNNEVVLRWKRNLMRSMRGIIALFPDFVLNWIERALISGLPFRQFIILGQKKWANSYEIKEPLLR